MKAKPLGWSKQQWSRAVFSPPGVAGDFYIRKQEMKLMLLLSLYLTQESVCKVSFVLLAFVVRV